MDGRGEDLLLCVPMTVDTTRMTCLQWRVIGGKGGRDSDHVHPSPLGDQRREAICIRQSTSKRVERCTSCSSSDVRRGGGGAKGRLLLVRSNRRSAGGDAWCRRLQSTAKNQVLGIYNNQMAMWPIAWVCSPRCPASQGPPALVGMTRPTRAPRPCCRGTRPPSASPPGLLCCSILTMTLQVELWMLVAMRSRSALLTAGSSSAIVSY